MICSLRSLPPADLARLRESPELVFDYLREKPGADFGPFTDLSLGKAWHGIHYLLTESPGKASLPLGFIFSGGEKLGDVDLGYGPARSFDPEGVRQIASALRSIQDHHLRDHYDPDEMEEVNVYPTIWTRDGDDGLDYLLENYQALERFLWSTADSGNALIIYVS